jgi:hypothetical protein
MGEKGVDKGCRGVHDLTPICSGIPANQLICLTAHILGTTPRLVAGSDFLQHVLQSNLPEHQLWIDLSSAAQVQISQRI